MADQPYEYDFSFADGPNAWTSWMPASVQNDGTYGYTRFQAPGSLDPNHIDGIGSLWLVSHLSIPTAGSPGALDLRDATIDITIRGEDFNAMGGKLMFWVCSYLPDGTIQYNYYSGVAVTNWANTGGDFAGQITDDWQTITVTLSDDPTQWTYAGNNVSAQGDWAYRYQPEPLSDSLANVNATLHLVVVTDSPDEKPTGFLDIASIDIHTAAPAVPVSNVPTVAMRETGVEDQVLAGHLVDGGLGTALPLIYTLVPGSAQHGTVVIDSLTGAYEFTPEANFSGIRDNPYAAGFQYVVSDGQQTTAAQTVAIFLSPINDAPVANTSSEDQQIAADALFQGTLLLGTDVDGDSLGYRVVDGSVQNGTLQLDGTTGRYTFLPDAGYLGDASFQYVVSDGQSVSEAKTVTLHVVTETDRLLRIDELVSLYLQNQFDALVEGMVRLADQGDRSASYNYGTWLLFGQHVTQSASLAAHYLAEAVGVVPDASLLLAQMYAQGNGVTRDYAQAENLLRGVPQLAAAHYQLAVLYELDPQVQDGAVAALQEYITAARMGSADAMYTLGRRYLSGEGVSADPHSAYFWLSVGQKFNAGPNLAQFRQLLGYNIGQAAQQLTASEVTALNLEIAAWSPGQAVPTNHQPTADLQAEDFAVHAAGTLHGTLLAGGDIDGDRLTFALVPDSTLHGLVTIDPITGAFTFLADGGYFGPASFDYVISDGELASAPKTVSVTIERVTSAAGDSVSTTEASPIYADADHGVLANDVLGADGVGLVVASVGGDPANLGVQIAGTYGNLVLNSDGSYVYAPNSDLVALIQGQSIIDRFAYTISDMAGGTASAQLEITVQGVGGTVLSGTGILFGTAFDDQLTVLSGHGILGGFAGNDRLIGSADTASELYGGTGDDVYVVANAGDTIIEHPGEGIDTIETALSSFRLRPNVENLTYTGTGDFIGVGNELDNVIIGGEGHNVLAGGAGDDRLIGSASVAGELNGGTGNDTFVVRNPGDTLVEAPGEGIDTVETALSSFRLRPNIENLTYTGTGDFIGVGNELDNVIIGSEAHNVLAGGAGDDRLIGSALIPGELNGGPGNDTFVVRNSGDTLVEAPGDGIDTVETALSSFRLRPNVENLTYTGTGDFIGVGNELDNVITGGTGHDILVGAEGNDRLIGQPGGASLFMGGIGDDVFVIHARGDSIVEYAGEGSDTVETDLSYFVLPSNVENLVFTGVTGFAGLGNELDNSIFGGVGDDVLTGGPGSDTITTGLGRDLIIYNSIDDSPAAAVGDVITDFMPGMDRIDLRAISNTLATNGVTLHFDPVHALTGVAGQVIASSDGIDTTILADVDGDGNADFHILLQGVTSVALKDFLI